MGYEVNPGNIIGAYYVEEHLSKGGMAYVVLASSGNKKYALKITKVTRNAEQDEQNTIAIRKEIDFLKKLSHDRIVKVFRLKMNEKNKRMRRKKLYYASAKDIPGMPWYFAMEYLAGGTLNEYVNKCGPLTVAEATNITGNIGLALKYLHEEDIAHNDVKPENVMFRKRIRANYPYDPVLIDFGTAEGVNNFKNEAGSWFIMPPERIRGAKGMDPPEVTKRIDPIKADVWSLGILLYQALTKSLPFPSSFEKRLTSQILNDHPKPIASRNRTVPDELDEFVVNKCLAKKPENRPTVKEFLEFTYKYSGRGVLATSIKDNYYD